MEYNALIGRSFCVLGALARDRGTQSLARPSRTRVPARRIVEARGARLMINSIKEDGTAVHVLVLLPGVRP